MGDGTLQGNFSKHPLTAFVLTNANFKTLADDGSDRRTADD
jgi:hypothetical protein